MLRIYRHTKGFYPSTIVAVSYDHESKEGRCHYRGGASSESYLEEAAINEAIATGVYVEIQKEELERLMHSDQRLMEAS